MPGQCYMERVLRCTWLVGLNAAKTPVWSENRRTPCAALRPTDSSGVPTPGNSRLSWKAQPAPHSKISSV
jgi:hypothetical protein